MKKRIDGIDKIAMGDAYQEMGNINLAITQENFHLETEGANLGYEMDTKEAKGKAE